MKSESKPFDAETFAYCAAGGVAAFLIVMMLAFPDRDKKPVAAEYVAKRPVVTPTPFVPKPYFPPPPPPTPPVEHRVGALQDSADRALARAAADAVKPIREYFAEARTNVKAFAADAASLDSGYYLLAEWIGIEAKNAHAEFLRKAFEMHVLQPEKLRDLLTAAANQYRAAALQIENRYLVDLKADLADDPTVATVSMSSLTDDDAFRKAYGELVTKAVPEIAQSLGERATIFVASEYVAGVVSAGVIGFGQRIGMIGNGWFGTAVVAIGTLGIGYAIQEGVNLILDALGYDGAKGIEAQTHAAVDRIRDRLLDGDAGAWEEYKSLRAKAGTLSPAEAKKRDDLLASGRFGLVRQFEIARDSQKSVRASVGRTLLADKK